jgi:DNA-binding CsgD family transcriptional regulator
MDKAVHGRRHGRDRSDRLRNSGQLPDVSDILQVFLGRLEAGMLEPSLHEVDGEPQEFLYDREFGGVRLVVIRPRRAPSRPHLLLSPREREISRMVAKGYPNKTIAAVLEISSWTVGTYLRRIFAKLGVGSRAAMVARLSEEGLLTDHTARAKETRSSEPMESRIRKTTESTKL